VLLSDTSSDEDDDDGDLSLTDAEVKEMLREHIRHKRYQRQFAEDKAVKLLFNFMSAWLILHLMFTVSQCYRTQLQFDGFL